MKVIPAIDIIGGACVRLTKGEFASKKVYATDPVAVAQDFERQGATLIHVVDLDGARTGVSANKELILKIAKSISIPLEVGGGIRDEVVAREYLSAGVARVVIGTKAQTDPAFLTSLIKEFGSARIVVALEIKGGKLAVEGWQKTLDTDGTDFAKRMKALGVTEILCTDVERDGTMTEPNYELVRSLAQMGFNVVASGGISDMKALTTLKSIGLFGAIVGKAIYEGTIDIKNALDILKPSSHLTKRIIPCLDVKDGKVVKGISFVDLQAVGDPVALGKKYSEEGADELVFLDISASKEGRETMFDIAAAVAREVFIPFTVGGGISSIEQIRRLLKLGADKISINTAAVQNPALINEAARAFGQQCVVVAIDAKKKDGKYKVFLKGGSEETPLEVVAWAREAEKRGAGELLLTSMDKDGTKDGYDIELLQKVSEAVNIPVIASGGAGTLEHMRAALSEGKADAALVASLFHYGEHTVAEAKEFLSARGIPIRVGV